MSVSLAELSASGRLNAKDLDVIYVAYGCISRSAVDAFLQGRPPAARSLPLVAKELTDRICGCQHHDGGCTELVAADEHTAHLRVQGACVYCPQIKYTMQILEDAIKFRAPDAEHVTIDGTDFKTRMEIPPGSQLTMPMLMRKTGMTFDDLDRELDAHPELSDEQLLRLAQRCYLRKRRNSTSSPT